MEDNNQLDHLFRDKLGEGQTSVPDDSWKAIQQKMAAGQGQPSKRKRMVPIPFLWLAASFLSGAFLSGFTVYTYDLKKENQVLKQWVAQESGKVREGQERKRAQEGNYPSEEEEGYPYGPWSLKGEGVEKSSTNQFYYISSVSEGKGNGTKNGVIKKLPLSSKRTAKEKKHRSNQSVYEEVAIKPEHEMQAKLSDNKTREVEAPLAPTLVYSSTERKNEAILQKDSLPSIVDTLKLLSKEEKKASTPKGKKAAKLFGFPVSVGFYLSPEIASRSVHFSQEADPELVKYKQNDQKVVGFSSGISVDIHLPRNFYVRTGLNYWNVGDKNTTVLKNVLRDSTTQTYTVKSDIPVSGVNGTPLYTFDSTSTSYQTYTVAANGPGVKISANNQVTNVTESISQYSSLVQNNYQYLGIPMVLGIKLGRSTVSLGMYSGIITNVLLSPHKTVLYVYEDGQSGHYTQSTRELTRFSLVYWGGLDVDVKLTPNWTLNISPNLKYSLTSIYKGEQSLKQLPYSMGLQFGVRYFIK